MKDECSCTQTVDCGSCSNFEAIGEDYLERNGVKGVGMLVKEFEELQSEVASYRTELINSALGEVERYRFRPY